MPAPPASPDHEDDAAPDGPVLFLTKLSRPHFIRFAKGPN